MKKSLVAAMFAVMMISLVGCGKASEPKTIETAKVVEEVTETEEAVEAATEVEAQDEVVDDDVAEKPVVDEELAGNRRTIFPILLHRVKSDYVRTVNC